MSRRYVRIARSAAGVSTATVTIVDGDLSAKWSTKTYLGEIGRAVGDAESCARRALEETRAKLDDLERVRE